MSPSKPRGARVALQNVRHSFRGARKAKKAKCDADMTLHQPLMFFCRAAALTVSLLIGINKIRNSLE